MTWLFEDPWTSIIGGTLLEIVLLVALVKTGRGFLLFVMGGVLLVTGGLVLLERLVVTERERVELTLYDCADAVEQNSVEAILQFVAPSATSARSRIRAELPAYKISNVSLSNLTIQVFETTPPTATADLIGHCWVDERRGGARMSAAQRFLVRLRKENDRWLLTDYEERPLISR